MSSAKSKIGIYTTENRWGGPQFKRVGSVHCGNFRDGTPSQREHSWYRWQPTVASEVDGDDPWLYVRECSMMGCDAKEYAADLPDLHDVLGLVALLDDRGEPPSESLVARVRDACTPRHAASAERLVENEAALRYVLDGITFAPSCLDMGWTWEIETIPGRGWLVNTTFRRPDTRTGEVGVGTGRKEFIAIGASESAVVKTAWLLAELIVRHELMEAFLYRGVRIFDPHRTVEELSMPEHVRKVSP